MLNNVMLATLGHGSILAIATPQAQLETVGHERGEKMNPLRVDQQD